MKIIQVLQPVIIPTSVGGINFQIYGLGDDNKLYIWDGEKKDWVVA